MRRTISVILSIALPAGAAVWAGIPAGISYQGRLTDVSGSPVADSTYSLRFVIYDAPVGGANLWESGYRPVAVESGLFTYVLGSDVPFPSNLFADSARWLAITVSPNPEMPPRVRLLGSPYAHQSEAADSAGTVHWDNIQGIPADIGGAVTEVIAGSGLSGGGGGGSVSLFVPANGINSGHIGPNTIGSTDIAAGAITGGHILDNTIGPEDIGGEAGASGSYRDQFPLPDWAGSFILDAVVDSVVINAPTSGVVVLVASGWFAMQHIAGGDDSFARLSVGTNNVGAIINLSNFTSFSLPSTAPTGTYRSSFSIAALEPISAGRQVFYLRGSRRTGILCDVGDAHFTGMFFSTTYGPVESPPAPQVEPEDNLDAFGDPAQDESR